ncbi:MAG TPA: Smr/MutS family protein [Gemmatimonadales bacterium]
MSPTTGQPTDGVLAQNQSAGTPSPFEGVAAPATLATLEFTTALDLVAGHAAGPLGAASVLARRPGADPDRIRADLGLIAEALGLLRHPEGFDIPAVPELGSSLERLRITGSVLEGPDLVVLRRTMTTARLVARELGRVAPRAPAIGALAVEVPGKAIEQRLEQALEDDGELRDNASSGLAHARRAVQAARDKLIRKLEAMLRSADAQAVPQGASVTVRNGRYVIPVRRDSRARPTGIVHDESGTAGTLFIEPAEAIELGNALREALADEAREVLKVLRELTDLVRPHLETIRAAHVMCVAADDLQARARYARASGAEVPALGEVGTLLVLRQARHPVLLAQAATTVPFDLDLQPGERTLLVSGPNAGGKTVLLKTVGLAAAMLQSGIVPPVGTGSVFPVFTRMLADIGDHQSIAANLSTFSAHVAILRQVLDVADDGTLVLLDEVGSGTDPAEGAALAWASLETLHQRRTLTLATTHLGALKTLASQQRGVVNGSMEFDAATLSPTYRFQKGVPGRSYGLAIARRLGVDPEVVSRAQSQVPEGERALDALLHEVERRDQVLRSRESELSLELEQTAQRATELSARLTDVEAREKAVRRHERDADSRARSQAREYLLEARKRVEAAIARGEEARSAEEAREARRALEAAVAEMAPRPDGRTAGRTGEQTGGRTDGQRISAGRRVRLGTGTLCQVASVRDDGKLVVTAGNVRMVVPEDSVVEVLAEEKAGRPSSPSVRPSVGPSVDAPFEIDLRGFSVDTAEAATVSAIDGAVLADHPFLRIIHGKGTGAVRAKVHELLKQDRRVARFALAPTNQGGAGATIAEFRR